MFLFLSVAHVFCIAQKLQNPNLQCHCGHQANSECTHFIRKCFYDNNRVVFALSLSVFHSIFSLVFVLLSFFQIVFLISIFLKVDLHLKLEANKRQRRHAFVLCTFNLPFFCSVPFFVCNFALCVFVKCSFVLLACDVPSIFVGRQTLARLGLMQFDCVSKHSPRLITVIF